MAFDSATIGVIAAAAFLAFRGGNCPRLPVKGGRGVVSTALGQALPMAGIGPGPEMTEALGRASFTSFHIAALLRAIPKAIAAKRKQSAIFGAVAGAAGALVGAISGGTKGASAGFQLGQAGAGLISAATSSGDEIAEMARDLQRSLSIINDQFARLGITDAMLPQASPIDVRFEQIGLRLEDWFLAAKACYGGFVSVQGVEVRDAYLQSEIDHEKALLKRAGVDLAADLEAFADYLEDPETAPKPEPHGMITPPEIVIKNTSGPASHSRFP